jgi:hypothetical protein
MAISHFDITRPFHQPSSTHHYGRAVFCAGKDRIMGAALKAAPVGKRLPFRVRGIH